jgi:acetylornithine aminotransferase
MIVEHRDKSSLAGVPGFYQPGALAERESQYFFHTYKRLALEIDRGEGVYLVGKDGTRYLDFFGGLAVNSLGYNQARVNEAIKQQVDKYIHLSNFFLQEPQVKLAEKLIGVTGYRRVFFSNSGTEAIEGALKLARKWAKGSQRRMFYGLSNAFHGRTMGALSLMDKAKYRDDYAPFVPNFGSLEFNNVDQLRATVNEQTLAIFLECIQGEGGIFVASHDFVQELNKLREKFGFLIIADEIQSGIGRTGKFFGFEHLGLRPDIVVLAKALGGGLPLGAILGGDRVAESFTPGVHGTTFGGNPVACAAGVVVLEEIVDRGLMKHAAEVGEFMKSEARKLQSELPQKISDVRGYGCMIGIELSEPGQPVADELQKRGILVNCTHETVLRLLPPLIIQREHCDIFFRELRSILS